MATSENIYQRNIHEMTKHTLQKGANNLASNFKKLGQISFTVIILYIFLLIKFEINLTTFIN